MSGLLLPALMVLLLALCALFEGSETGFYSLSRLRVEAAARAGRRSARILQSLMADEAGLLITLLVATNLVLECLAWLVQGRLEALGVLPEAWRELVVTAVATPLVLVFGELLPKDLFHRRPHALMSHAALFLAGAKLLLAPLVLPLRLASRGLEKLLGLSGQQVERAFVRDFVAEVLEEGKRGGALSPRAEVLARNVLALRSIPLSSVMVPWNEVERVALQEPLAQARERVARSAYTRLPVLGEGGAVAGYVHQLEILADEQGRDVASHLREMECLPADVSVGRALARMRLFGQRMALVGTPERPAGLVTLKDLLEKISGDLARW